jgi:hypothetical protein
MLHGGTKLHIFQLQSWRHGQGCKPCGRRLASAAAKVSNGLLTGHGGGIAGFQKPLDAVLWHVSTEGALGDGGHVGRICGALVRFSQPVCHVLQGLQLLSEPITHRAFKWQKGGGPSLHCPMCFLVAERYAARPLRWLVWRRLRPLWRGGSVSWACTPCAPASLPRTSPMLCWA